MWKIERRKKYQAKLLNISVLKAFSIVLVFIAGEQTHMKSMGVRCHGNVINLKWYVYTNREYRYFIIIETHR